MNPDTYVLPVVNILLEKAERHIKYIVSTSSYVRNLQKKREVLNARKNYISGRIDEGERRSQRPTEEVIVWQSQVVDMLNNMDIALNIAQETASCVCSIRAKHELGRRCDDMIKETDELLERSASLFHSVEMVDCDTSNIVKSMPYVVQESLASYFAEACKCIEDNNSKVNTIGIWGLGGVGKTTLLKMIHNHFVGNSSMFEAIIWTVASSEQSNVFRVQSEIVRKLRLKEVDDIESQADLIYSYLENKNFLLFVDDLWKDVDLHKVGVPNLNDGNGCRKNRKVIFTTRSKDVCSEMDAKKIIEVKCLNPTQSLILFTEKVGEEVIQSHFGIPKLAEDIVKECQGLPLALITIGRAMSMKPNLEDWKITLDLLKNSQGHQVMGVEEKLLSVLKISYDYLASEKLRKCFLTISLWPEDHMISENKLIELWMGIGLIDNFESKHEVYQLGHSLVSGLQAACLLEDVESNENLFGDRSVKVKLHDVLRDLALWLISDGGKNKNKWIVKAGIQLKNAPNLKAKWREAEYVSLMQNNIEELPSDIPSCPSLLVLVLRGNRLMDNSSFGQFRSLTYLDLSWNSLCVFPESVCDLTQLRYLNLSSNDISHLPTELRNLKMLRYLILRHTNIINIPGGVLAELAELLVLDMFNHIGIFEGPLVDVEELKSIEKNLLSFGTNVTSEEGLSKLMLLSKLPIHDLLINKLRGTSFHLMAATRNPHLLEELHICFSGDLLEIVFDKDKTYQDIASLNLKIISLSSLWNLKRIIWKAITPEILFAELQEVTIEACGLLKDITWVIHLPSLKFLHIDDCKSMRIAINSDMDRQVLTFPSLEVFYLVRMYNLEKICYGSLAFPQLKQISIGRCPNLKTLPFVVETTPKLMKIWGEKEWWEEVEWEDDNSRSHFSRFCTGLFIV